MIIYQNRLKKTIERIEQKNQISENDIDAIISKTRQLIEASNKQESYITLNLYCNWFLHTELKQSMKVYRILESIHNEILSDTMKSDPNKHTKEIIPKVVKCLELDRLRKDFIDLFQIYEISISIFINGVFWKIFILYLLSNLIDKPIKFPEKILDDSNINLTQKEKKIRNICDRMKAKSIENSWCINYSNNSWEEYRLLPMFVTYLIIIQEDNKACLEIGFAYNNKGENKYPVKINMPFLNMPTVLDFV